MSISIDPPFYVDDETEPPKSGQMNNYVIYSSLLPAPTNYSHIYLCSEQRGHEIKVIKFIKLYEDKLECVLNEVQLMRETSHPNILMCETDFRSGAYWCLILPYSKERSLQTYLNNRQRPFSESDACFIMHQMLQSVDYLHDSGIFHRDIKLDNFIVFIENHPNAPKVCLSDFGFAKRFNPGETSEKFEFLGTLEYLAPEIVNKKQYDESVDVWALGICLFVLLTGQFPFPDSSLYPNSCKERIAEGKLSLEILEKNEISNEATNLIKLMCNVDPEKRISAKQALSHNWIKNGVKSPMEQSYYQFLGSESEFLSPSFV